MRRMITITKTGRSSIIQKTEDKTKDSQGGRKREGGGREGGMQARRAELALDSLGKSTMNSRLGQRWQARYSWTYPA